MKRNVLMLIVILMICAILPCAGAEEEMQNARTYEDKVAYAVETFGFDDDLAYPYFPTHLDPVCYNGYLSLTAGFKDGESYAAYGGYTDTDVQDYLGYLQYWGYEVTEHSSALEGIREWHAVCPSPRNDGKGLMEKMRVYHSPEWEMLTVAYPYLDGVLYETWSESTFYAFGSRQAFALPYAMEVAGVGMTIDEIRCMDEVEIFSETEPVMSPHSSMRMNDELRMTPGAENSWRLNVTGNINKRHRSILGVHLSFDRPVHQEWLEKLCLATAEVSEQEAHFAQVPMLYLYESNGTLHTWTDETESSSVWVLFPPCYYGDQEAWRIYARVMETANAWIGDLREWTYVDLYPPFEMEEEEDTPQPTPAINWEDWTWN